MAENALMILIWIIPWIILGWLFFPLSFLIFRNFPDRGFIFSKIIAITLITYITWILVDSHILQYQKTTVYLGLLIPLFIQWIFLKKIKKLNEELITFIRNKWKLLLTEEALFLFLFSVGILIRLAAPVVFRHAYVSENYMNLMFINKLNASTIFPPDDGWMSGVSLNYYYFGPLIFSVFSKLVSVSVNSYFSFWNITLYVLGSLAFFGLFLAITKNKLFSFLGILIPFFSSRLDLIWAFVKKIPISAYDFNNNSLIPKTSNEFPFYELINHNPHSQVISSIYILFLLSLIYSLYLEKERKFSRHLILVSLIGFVLGVILFTHAWDSVALMAIIASTIFIKYKVSFRTIISAVAILGFSVLPFITFWLNYRPPIQKIIFGHTGVSYVYILIVFGSFLLPIFLYFVHLIFQLIKGDKKIKFLNENIFFCLCIFAGITLTLVPYFLYFSDCWNGPFNTFYKFYYEAWILLAVGATGSIYFLITNLRGLSRIIIFSFITSLLTISFIGSTLALNQRSGERKGNLYANSLDSFKYYKKWSKDEFDAISWIEKNIPPNAVILEDGSDDWKMSGRVASLTGLSTVIANPFHEYCWRSNVPEIKNRIKEVNDIFENPKLSVKQDLIQKYNVNYIFIGEKEKSKYDDKKLMKLTLLGEIVFQNKSVKIIKI